MNSTTSRRSFMASAAAAIAAMLGIKKAVPEVPEPSGIEVEYTLVEVPAAFLAEIPQRKTVLPTPVEVFQRFGLDPDPWQREVLDTFLDRDFLDRDVIAVVHRQAGATTVCAAAAVAAALRNPKRVVAVVSRSGVHRSNMDFLIGGIGASDIVNSTHRSRAIDGMQECTTMTLVNGSVIAFVGDEQELRGWDNVSHIVIDDASLVADGMFGGLGPIRAASAAKVLAVSTPKIQRGWFYQAIDALRGNPGEPKLVATFASECPRISKKFLKRERKRLGQAYYEQLYFGRFLDIADL